MNIAKIFEEHNLVPKLIPEAPKSALAVFFPSHVRVTGGNVLSPEKVNEQPAVMWQAENNSLYTLILTDLDTTPGQFTANGNETCLWLVTNIPGTHVDGGDELISFTASNNNNNSIGLHRFVFLLYKQPGIFYSHAKESAFNTKIAVADADIDHLNWNTAEFVRKYDLGSPVAGNFYQADFNGYVPTMIAEPVLKLMGRGPKVPIFVPWAVVSK